MKSLYFGVAALAVAGLFSAPAQAGKEGYLTDKAGNIVMTKTGQCVRTKSWTPETADAECLKKAGIKR